jgi:hypothetical protein
VNVLAGFAFTVTAGCDSAHSDGVSFQLLSALMAGAGHLLPHLPHDLGRADGCSRPEP